MGELIQRLPLTLSWWLKLLVLCLGHSEKGSWAGFPSLGEESKRCAGAKARAAEEGLKDSQEGPQLPSPCPKEPKQEAA